MNCLECGKEINKRRKYCSKTCSAKHGHKRHKLGLTPVSVLVSCDSCGNEFYNRSGSQRFCSANCRINEVYKGKYYLFLRDEFRCIYCGKSSIEDKKQLQPEHVIPKEKGGEDIAINLVTSCVDCNLQKRNNTIENEIFKRIIEEIEKRNIKFNLNNQQKIKLK